MVGSSHLTLSDVSSQSRSLVSPGKRSSRGIRQYSRENPTLEYCLTRIKGWNKIAMCIVYFPARAMFLRNGADVPACFRFLCQGAWPTTEAATSERDVEKHEREHTNVVTLDKREIARRHAGWLKNSKSHHSRRRRDSLMILAPFARCRSRLSCCQQLTPFPGQEAQQFRYSADDLPKRTYAIRPVWPQDRQGWQDGKSQGTERHLLHTHDHGMTHTTVVYITVTSASKTGN